MDGRTNSLNAPSKSDDITTINFSESPLTSFKLTLDPYIYSNSQETITREKVQVELFSLTRNHSVTIKNVKYVNTNTSASYKMPVLTYYTSVGTTEYICSLKPFNLLKPDVQNGLQTMISRSDLSNAKIRIPCRLGYDIWNVSATITDGNVEVTDIQPEGILSSRNSSFNYSSNNLEFIPAIEIL